jgi:Sigma-54 interaction domain
MTRRRLAAMNHPTDRLVGHSPSIRALRAQIRRLVAFDTVGNPSVPTLLLQGETGTGKGLVARVIHESGPRARGPFIEVNCAAIPDALLEAELFGFEAGAFTDAKHAKPGLFEAASGGTLLLDGSCVVTVPDVVISRHARHSHYRTSGRSPLPDVAGATLAPGRPTRPSLREHGAAVVPCSRPPHGPFPAYRCRACEGD